MHFVGIGGAGMSGIARIMLARGLPVSGSDAKDSGRRSPRCAPSARPSTSGTRPTNVGDADTVVVSTAIRPSNPELLAADAARACGCSTGPRALASVMVGRRAVAVAGTHGKTTTTSLLTVAIQHCGADPSFAIGGNLNESGANAHNGSGDVFVAEADESDGSFLLYSPHAAIVTNVEPDHLDHYGTGRGGRGGVRRFAERVEPGGFLVACADDAGSAPAGRGGAGETGVDVRTYGESPAADLRLDGLVTRGLGSSFEAVLRGRRLGRVELRLPGRHNALNAAAALAVGVGLGFPVERLREGLASFSGTRRRFEHKGTVGGVRVYDYYAHHPTELAADLAAARDVADGGRVVVVFQPHLFSRTQFFAEDFGRALGLADEVVVMDVYAAREDPVPGVTGALVAAAVPLPPQQVVFEPSWSAVAGHLAERAKPGDVVITCGAGDVTMIGPEVLARLEPQRPEGES